MIRGLALGSSLLVACGPSPAPAPVPASAPPVEPAAPAPREVEVDPFSGRAVEGRPARIRSQRYQLSFPLPDRGGWKLAAKDKSRFVTITHAVSGSVILFARWRASGVMNRQRCAEQAHLWRELPGAEADPETAELIETPRGYDTGVVVDFVRVGPDQASGYAAAFGALGRSCLAVVFQTAARGPQAERLVGERLAVVRAAVLPRLRLHDDRDIDPREP